MVIGKARFRREVVHEVVVVSKILEFGAIGRRLEALEHREDRKCSVADPTAHLPRRNRKVPREIVGNAGDRGATAGNESWIVCVCI